MKKKALIAFLFIGAVSMIAMSNHYLHVNDSGILLRKEIASSPWYFYAFRVHVLFGLIAITIGPSQFINRIRTQRRRVHKSLGYLYVLSVALSSLAGITVAPFAMGGLTSAVGFTILGCLWFSTMIKSITSAIGNNFESHKKWSYFNYALTFSSITQRTLLLIPLLTSIPFMPIYQLSAWLPWVINLSIAYRLLKSSPTFKPTVITSHVN